MNGYFGKEEALAWVGRRFRTKVDFSGVPAGTSGIVVKADESDLGWTLRIRWELSDRGWPLDDWFSKRELELFLVPFPEEGRP